jgi:hypothetical protein
VSHKSPSERRLENLSRCTDVALCPANCKKISWSGSQSWIAEMRQNTSIIQVPYLPISHEGNQRLECERGSLDITPYETICALFPSSRAIRIVVLPLTQLRPRRISYIILLSLSNGKIRKLIPCLRSTFSPSFSRTCRKVRHMSQHMLHPVIPDVVSAVQHHLFG